MEHDRCTRTFDRKDDFPLSDSGESGCRLHGPSDFGFAILDFGLVVRLGPLLVRQLTSPEVALGTVA